MNDTISDTVRREILRLDMHDVPAAEIARQTGAKRTTISSIINRIRGTKKSTYRGDVILLCNPMKDTLRPGARFNWPDLNSMLTLSSLANGTLFEVKRRDGSMYRVEVQNGKLIEYD